MSGDNAAEAHRVISTLPSGDTLDQAYAYAQAHATLPLYILTGMARHRTANLLSYWSAYWSEMTDEAHGVLDDEGKAEFRQIALTIESRLGLSNE